MIPAARSAHLDDVYRELLLRRGQADQFLGGTGRAGQCTELLAEHPGHVRELLFPADRAHDVAATSVELGSPKEIRVGVAHRGDASPARVHLGKQRPSLKGVVHHLSLKSHENQSTCGRRHRGQPPSVLRNRGDRNYAPPVPTRRSPTTRARDVDRTDTCATLDEARADGQLSEFEYRARIELATEAGTLADLHTLIEDLQNESNLAPMASAIEMTHPLQTAKASRIGFFAVAVPVVVVLLALTFGIRACAVTDDPVSIYGSVGYRNPAVVADIVDALAQKTGTTVVDSLGLYPDYAVIWMPAPNTPQKQVTYTYRDGSLGDYDDNFSSSRDFDEPQIDLTTVDLTKVAGIIAGAAESLNISRVDSYTVRFAGSDNGPQITVSAENTDEESGTLTFDPAGNFIRVSPFEFG